MKKICVFLICVAVISISINVHAADYGNVYCKSNSECKKIALTFDDGPHPRFTEEILDILSDYGITATFFIIGINAENYPESLSKIAESGCEIGNHTYSHKNIKSMTRSELEDEIKHCENVIYSLTGKRSTLFRPPRGYLSNDLTTVTEKLGYNVVLWNIDTLDWSLNPSEKICMTVMKDHKGGDIILMHDYVSGGNTTCNALRLFIPKLLNEGYEFVTVSELIA